MYGISSPDTAIPSASLIEMLDQWELRMIMEFLSPFDTLILHSSSALAEDINTVPRWKALCPDSMLMHAAKNGNRELCILAKTWIDANNITINFERMLSKATACTDPSRARDICCLAKEWIDTTGGRMDFNCMLRSAAKHGNRELCILAKTWLNDTGVEIDFSEMLSVVATCPDIAKIRDVCDLAEEWLGDRISFNSLLWSAAEEGRRDVCILAHELVIATRTEEFAYNEMLQSAARGGHRDICELAREWARPGENDIPLNFDSMYEVAACYYNLDICTLAVEWGAKPRERFIVAAGGEF